MNLLKKAKSYYHYLKGDDLLSDVVDLEECRKHKEALAKAFPYDTGFEVFSFPVWGAAVWDCTNKKWVRVIFADGQEINLEQCEVVLHDDGIQIISWGRWPEEE